MGARLSGGAGFYECHNRAPVSAVKLKRLQETNVLGSSPTALAVALAFDQIWGHRLQVEVFLLIFKLLQCLLSLGRVLNNGVKFLIILLKWISLNF